MDVGVRVRSGLQEYMHGSANIGDTHTKWT